MHFNYSNLLTWNNLSIVLDVLIIWYLVYRLIMLIRGTKPSNWPRGLSSSLSLGSLLDCFSFML